MGDQSSSPNGVIPFFMSNEAAEKHGLKIGSEPTDLIGRKSFNTAKILEEIKDSSGMSAFEPIQSYIDKCEMEEFVIVCDVDSTYGEMFLLLHEVDSIKSFYVRKNRSRSRQFHSATGATFIKNIHAENCTKIIR